MKRIIDGKTYNTKTATLICDTSNEYSRSDFKFESSDLYVTKKGAYFIAGSGGALSRFARRVSDGYCGGEGIIPISREDALSECERHGDTDDAAEFFGGMLTDA